MPWAVTAGALVGGLMSSTTPKQDPMQSVVASDPFWTSRMQYINPLNQLVQGGPGSITKDPVYKWEQQQGMQGVQRAMAAQGLSLSGREMLALQNQSMSTANQFYGQKLGTLMQLTGASQNPAVAGQAYSNTVQNNITAQNSAMAAGMSMGSKTYANMNPPTK